MTRRRKFLAAFVALLGGRRLKAQTGSWTPTEVYEVRFEHTGDSDQHDQVINWWRTQVTAERALQYTVQPQPVQRGTVWWCPVTIRLVVLDATLPAEMPTMRDDFAAMFPTILSGVWMFRQTVDLWETT